MSINLDKLFESSNEHGITNDQEMVVSDYSHTDFGRILYECSYKLPKGYPTVDRGVFTEINEVLIINEALQAEGLPTLPLPETILLRESDTDIKEVTVCIAADLCNLFGSAMAKALEAFAADKNAVPNEIFQIAKVVNGKDLATELYTSRYNYYMKDRQELVNQLSVLGMGAGKVNLKVKVNSILSGLALNKRYGAVYLVRDEENFNSIKTYATKLWKAEYGEQLFPDNWCPADIFISSTDPTQIAGAAKQTKHLILKVESEVPLNNFFADPTKKVPAGKFIGISLKQEVAQGGKGTKFTTNVLLDAKQEDFTKSGMIDESVSKKIINHKGFIRYAHKPGKKEMTQPATKLMEKGLPVLGITKGTKEGKAKYVALKLDAVESALKSIGTIQKLHTLKTIPANIRNYIILVDTAAEKAAKQSGSIQQKKLMFIESRDAFLNALKKSNVKTSSVTPSDALVEQMQKKLGKSFDVYMVQKIATYGFYVGVFNNWTAKTKKLKPYFRDISKVSNPFVALAMFCIGEAGITPPFTKLKGYGSWDDFTHDYTVDVDKTAQDVKVTDNATAGGFDSNFKIYFGKSKSYDVTLSFRFSNTSIRVEVQNIKHL